MNTTNAPAATNPITDPDVRALAVATDTRLAELAGERAKTERDIDYAIDTVRSLLKHRCRHITKTQKVWPTTPDEAIAELTAKLDAGTVESWNVESARKALATITTGHADLVRISAQIVEQNTVWAANGRWSRFYLVEGSSGHIHYDVSGWRCSRRMTTAHGWFPELSGLTEADAVAQLGPKLCTVCFPSAPVEWTVGTPKSARCPGAGAAPVAGTRKRIGMNTYGECTGCGTRQIVTLHSGVRAHKPKA